jgi:hypothetical protein
MGMFWHISDSTEKVERQDEISTVETVRGHRTFAIVDRSGTPKVVDSQNNQKKMVRMSVEN